MCLQQLSDLWKISPFVAVSASDVSHASVLHSASILSLLFYVWPHLSLCSCHTGKDLDSHLEFITLNLIEVKLIFAMATLDTAEQRAGCVMLSNSAFDLHSLSVTKISL